MFIVSERYRLAAAAELNKSLLLELLECVLGDRLYKSSVADSRQDIDDQSNLSKYHKSSAVAEMGDRGHNRNGPKRGGGAVPLSRSVVIHGGSRGQPLHQVGRSLGAKISGGRGRP